MYERVAVSNLNTLTGFVIHIMFYWNSKRPKRGDINFRYSPFFLDMLRYVFKSNMCLTLFLFIVDESKVKLKQKL